MRIHTEAALKDAIDPTVVDLTPDLTSTYKRRVESLATTLNGVEDRPKAISLLRGLIQRVVIRPKAAHGAFDIELHGTWLEF